MKTFNRLFSGMRGALLTACLLTGFANAATPATDGPTFSELLARAKAQAAAGHRWGPAGDNMTETLLDMMELVPTATADQLAELSELLQSAETTPQKETPGTVPFGGPPAPPTRAGIPPPGLKTPLPEIAPLAPPVPSTPTPLPSVPSSPPQVTPLPPSPLQVTPLQGTPPQVTPLPVPPPDPERTLNALPNLTTTESSARAAILYARGLEAEHRGDFSAARRFYLSAAQKGDAVAAKSLGRLYDPAYLRHIVVGGLAPDPALARQWYERAIQLGDSEAEPLLQALPPR